MRTDEQRRAFAMECWEIEKQGGDVLEYIRINWPSYTPGAAWFNLQRVYLPEKNMTSGKPPKEGGEEGMRRDRKETLDGIIEALRKGQHPFDYLESIGYLNAQQAYVDTRKWAKKNDPARFMQLPASMRGLNVKPKSKPINFKKEPVPELKAGEALPVKLPKATGENPSDEQKAPETVTFGGKTYEKMEKPDQNFQKAEQSGPIKWDNEAMTEGPQLISMRKLSTKEVPLPLPVCAVKSRVKGEWRLARTKGYVHLTYEEGLQREEKCISLSTEEWLKLAEEIPVMLMQLRLTK